MTKINIVGRVETVSPIHSEHSGVRTVKRVASLSNANNFLT